MENNIVSEAKLKISKEPLNLFNIKSKYIHPDNEMTFEDTDPIIFNKYQNILNRSIQTYTYKPMFKYKPEYVAYLIYGTPSYDYLIMHANGISSKKLFVEQSFTNREIKYYSKEAIKEIENNISNMDKQDVNELISENFIL